jgi:hypothetical protein
MENPMRATFKAATLVLLTATSGINPDGAVAADPAATPDNLCDYCKDYTDAGTGADAVASEYRPGTGYAADPNNNPEPAALRHEREVRLQIFMPRLQTESR